MGSESSYILIRVGAYTPMKAGGLNMLKLGHLRSTMIGNALYRLYKQVGYELLINKERNE